MLNAAYPFSVQCICLILLHLLSMVKDYISSVKQGKLSGDPALYQVHDRIMYTQSPLNPHSLFTQSSLVVSRRRYTVIHLHE